jgi:hypothetical protein
MYGEKLRIFTWHSFLSSKNIPYLGSAWLEESRHGRNVIGVGVRQGKTRPQNQPIRHASAYLPAAAWAASSQALMMPMLLP